jgi:hypothetical protein
LPALCRNSLYSPNTLADGGFGALISLKFRPETPAASVQRVVRSVTTTTSDGAIQFDTAPGLAFTKPLAASINGKSLHSPRWSAILLTMIAQVKAKGFEGDKLVRELAIPAKAEQYEEEGFKYHPDLGISVQGQSASDCWKEVERLAKKWHMPTIVEFWWRQNPKAQYPGKTGVLRSGTA